MKISFRTIKVGDEIITREQRFQDYLLRHPKEARKLKDKEEKRLSSLEDKVEKQMWRQWTRDKRRQEYLQLKAMDWTLQKIANKEGITRERVRQILLGDKYRASNNS